MKAHKIKSIILALVVTTVTGAGLASCNKGTEPGETNVERSTLRETEPQENNYSQGSETDTTDMERFYDHADHENHDDNVNGGGAVLSGDGKTSGVERDDVNQ
ncbi:hypothetical protein ACFSKU_09595 [Pontibacter silvestris]|uniref:Uncharacterized protein n=1 Tax=Pontibacter silvestris TaxID=2305183 RepID=A0ABW4WWM1_9BACT|nr:hypothetical protein [Pontibacter silvestris]MCC9137581.1 hypothetical protein [Pontibacter silvestris]